MERYEGELQALICEVEPDFDIDVLYQRIVRLFEIVGESGSEVCIVLTDDAEIRAMNLEWRGIDSATDVLSFPMREGEPAPEGLPLGDIMISVESARRYVENGEHKARMNEVSGLETPIESWSLADEVLFLVIHGTLHLLGFDHESEADEEEMKARELALWEACMEGNSDDYIER